ncbi:MAG TPA: hypothetical protein VGR06_08695 [Actinophytocola sp.]|uniref:alpha/beta fold hydrolase n=1 Tax=Actinophytocola sp. TaxID=1872138 RepID=UPI002E0098B3|nr:hypothetical protein [Actinophytocola sp.]
MAETTRPQVTNIRVSGGAGGFEAHLDDLALLGRATEDVAENIVGIAVSTHRFLADPNVLASAVLNPVGVTRFETALLGALDGADGLTATSGGIALRGPALRATAAAYAEADQLGAQALDAVRWIEGAALTPAAAAVAAGLATSPFGLIGGAVAVKTGAAERFLVEHPGLADQIIGGIPGGVSLISQVVGRPVSLTSLTGAIAELFPDSEPKPLPENHKAPTDPRAGTPPLGVGDIVDGLDHRNDTASNQGLASDQRYNLDIRKITGPDGRVAYIVDIPGTRPEGPLQGPTNANDMGVNVDSLAGHETVLEKGITQALRNAGVPRDAPVLLVGHSQGGMIAAQAAQHYTRSGEFNVTHVITAGSPIGRMPIPDKVQVLSLENSGDIVPHLDAADNPNSHNRTTVQFDSQTGTIVGNHGVKGNYTDAAHRLDASQDASVRHFRESLGAFTGGSKVETLQYKVERQVP